MMFFCCVCIYANAQDHMYSQFFNSPVYLNPALSGQFEGDLRLNLIYRNQWTNIPGQLNYLSASLDYKMPQFGGGFGVIFNKSNEGTAYLVRNNVMGTYSYSVGSDAFVLSFGIQGGFTNNRIDQTKLVFSDQLDPSTGYNPGTTTSASGLLLAQRNYFDSGAGISLVAGNFLLGGAMHHINQPDQSFTNSKSLLPRRLTFHASYRYNLDNYADGDDGTYLIPSVVVYDQSKSRSMSAGMQFKRQGINAGVWYRTNQDGGRDALVVSLIFDIFTGQNKNNKIRFGISHDATTSKLNYYNTNGTTEGSLSLEAAFPNRANGYWKFSESVRCYDFY